MNTLCMKRILLYLLLALVVLSSCGDAAKLRYARKLYERKSYAEAMKVAESASPSSKERNSILAESAFKNLLMQKSADAFALITVAELTDEQKQMYCEALRQTGGFPA